MGICLSLAMTRTEQEKNADEIDREKATRQDLEEMMWGMENGLIKCAGRSIASWRSERVWDVVVVEVLHKHWWGRRRESGVLVLPRGRCRVVSGRRRSHRVWGALLGCL